MKLLEMTTHAFAQVRPILGFWPVGTIEAHDLGPLGTDVIAPQKLAQDLAPEFHAVLLPTLPYGLVSTLSGYPGGMWMSPETYRQMIFELLASLIISGVKAVVIFNGHGGNSQALGATLPRLWKEEGLKAAFIDWWEVAEADSEAFFGGAGGHGGADELALVHAANPTLVPEHWDGSRAYAHRPGVKVWPAPRSALCYSKAEAKPFCPESAAAYYDVIKQRVRTVVQDILAGWEAFDELR